MIKNITSFSEIFHDRDTVLKMIETGDSIIKTLGIPEKRKCELLEKNKGLLKFIGQGSEGEIYSLSENYVIKKEQYPLDTFEFTEKSELSWNELKLMQFEKTIKKFESSKYRGKITLLKPPNPCLLKNNKEYDALPNNKIKYVSVDNGSYICENSFFSEFVISSYAGKLKKYCPFFLDTYSMFSCLDGDMDYPFLNIYELMDKIDGDLEKFRDYYVNSTDYMNSLYVMIIFAMIVYQTEYNISHNDLHLGNVFVSVVTQNQTFNDKKFMDYDWYHLRIDGTNLYIPACPLIPKIGDFGLSIKYKKPIVGSSIVFEDDFDDEYKGWIPNIFFPQYDLIFLTTSFLQLVDKYKVPFRENIGDLIADSLNFITGYEFKSNILCDMVKKNIVREKDGYRPVLDKLYDLKKPFELINGPVKQKFGLRPKTGKIMTIGQYDTKNSPFKFS